MLETINQDTLDFMVADAITRLVLLGCGWNKSALESIEAAIDNGVLKMEDVTLDRNEMGYITDKPLLSRIRELITNSILSEPEFNRISTKFNIPLPDDMPSISSFLRD